MQGQPIERKYRLTKIAKGDYILPGNNGRIIFRLSRYMDGPTTGLMDWPKDRWVWGAWWCLGSQEALQKYVDPLDWNLWDEIAACCPTRNDAILAALDWETRR